MIRPFSEIEYPPSQASLAKAAMIARLESLKSSSDSLMGVIAARLNAEEQQDLAETEKLTAEQERLVENMKALALG